MRWLLPAGLVMLLVALLSSCSLLNQAPIVSIVASRFTGNSPLTIAFNASDSYDPDGSIVTYAWDFGDGSIDAGITTSHTFTTTTVRTFTVTLTTTDNSGGRATSTQSIEVLPAGSSGSNPPTARFSAKPSYGNSPLTVQFDASLSYDADGTISVYAWDFGDGSTGAGETILHTFTAVATTNITVTLTVTDNTGSTGSTSLVVTAMVPVIVPTDGPTASFTAFTPVLLHHSDNPSSSPSLFEVTFDPSASTAAAGGHYIEFYLWNFGDGETLSMTTDAKFEHTYELRAPAHTFVVTLTVIDEQGLPDSTVGNVTVTN